MGALRALLLKSAEVRAGLAMATERGRDARVCIAPRIPDVPICPMSAMMGAGTSCAPLPALVLFFSEINGRLASLGDLD